ncbi:MAG: cyclic nucleotide-binding domain-containing protein, partial [Acidobacteria bacterium]|nr:cyclic nucleotide-binding domain-containing protein [Acidobacteriota bacterium]
MDREAIGDFVRSVGAFENFDHDVLERLATLLHPQFLKGGDLAVRAGDPPDGLYLVVRGRLAVLDGDDERIAVLSAGDVFGEVAALGSLERTRTVTAIRDSELLKLEQRDIDLLFREQGDVARALSRHAIARLVNSDGELQQRIPATVAVIGIGADTSTDSTVSALERVVERSTVLRAADVEDLDETTRTEKLESIERNCDLTVFDVGPISMTDEDSDATQWTDQCIRQADSVVLVAQSAAMEHRRSDARWIRARLSTQHCITELIVEHAATASIPSDPASWIDMTAPHRAHNVRAADLTTADRAARLITGRGRGLVFSGGAAKGLAHIGAWRAICDLEIPIDAVAGVSFGALLGAGVALEYTPERMTQLVTERLIGERKLYDATLPIVALFKGGGMTRELTDLGEGRSFDQVWRSFCCCACDLNSGELITLSKGPLWRGVRASLSIPGLFPPLREDQRVLVD